VAGSPEGGQGDADMSVRSALRHNPGATEAGPCALAAARRAVRLGQTEQAKPIFAARVQDDATDAEGWHGLGCITVLMGGLAAGAAALDRAAVLASAPERAMSAGLRSAIETDRGTLALLTGDRPRAARHFGAARAIDPFSVGAARGLARTAWLDGDAGTALDVLLSPADRDHPATDRGLLLDATALALVAGALDRAASLVERLPQAYFDDDQTMLVLGGADGATLEQNGGTEPGSAARLVAPEDIARFVAGADPTVVADHLRSRRRPGEAVVWMRWALGPGGESGTPGDRFALADALAQSGRAAEAVALMRDTLPAVPGNPRAVSNTVLTMLFDPACPNAMAFAGGHPTFAERSVGRAAVPSESHADLKLGYLCGDFRAHSNAAGIRALFEGGVRPGFRRYAYHTDRRCDGTTDWFRSASDGWCDAAALSDTDLAARIRSDGIDILIDLAGHTAGNRLGVFRQRPAAVQLSWINATGLSCMNGVLTDAGMYPPDIPLPGEPPVRLPLGALPYRPGADLPEPVGPPDDRAGPLFGFFNNPLKISEPLLDAWAVILARVPDARLLLKFGSLDDPVIRLDLARRLARRGVAPHRLQFAGMTLWEDHLRTLSTLDIALDSFPGNGGMTSWETVCMGVPLVCLRGDRPNGRVSASILAGLGRADLVAETAEAYIDLAVALAIDPARRRELGGAARTAARASPLTQDGGYVGQVETALRRFWQDTVATVGQGGDV